ncbi:hypothetical protein CEP54_002037 [Fusarium duplospermum]|uniref:Heterokaryon incompatibility domain-containing protein n=1 Tax=Fusarium duplospermum TaxID=1325734 RepID=A0A428QXL4_9HYPO|nr:hypothetical protein CEP54_002037 [Fusarium duplospermum]
MAQADPSSSVDEAFTYGKAQLGPDQLRILFLLPEYCEEDGSDVHCCLVRLDLKATETLDPKRHPFMALSYVWGAPTPQKKIFINGKQKGVSPGLYEALLHIRDTMAPVSLWVDAICINQDDFGERAREVLKMKRIYAECQAVLYWLGVPESSSLFHRQWGVSPAEVFVDFGQVYDELCERGEENEQNAFRVWESLYNHDPLLIMRLSESLGTFLSLPFWKRVWITQELVLAQDGFFMWGVHRFNMKLLEAIRPLQTTAQPRTSFGADSGPFLKPYSSMLGAIGMRSRQAGFVEALLNMRYRLATMEHDYIYGLLGISDPQDIVPNYNKTKKEVFLEAFRTALSQETNLDILSACDRGWAKCADPSNRPDGGDWPTWLPDWSHHPLKMDEASYDFTIRSILLDLQEVLPVSFSAGGSTESVASILKDSTHLRLRGIEFDTVAQRIPVKDDEFSSVSLDKIQDGWYHKVKKLWHEGKLHPGYATLTALKKTCIKTMQYGRDETFGKEHFDKVFETPDEKNIRCSNANDDNSELLEEEDESDNEAKYKPQTVAPLYIQRNKSSYFITRRGLLGRSPVPVQVGDSICVFLGAKVPFLLRPAKDDSSVFQLAGEAYIYGIMKGAALRVMKGQEKDFVLV